MKNKRILDPMNYEETCFYITYKNMGNHQTEYCHNLNGFEEFFTWLGSNCGEYFINQAKELIEEYPFKEDASSAICCGKVINQPLINMHINWVNSKIKYEK